MSHLSLETIARLVEDTPNGEESAHLESCAACRAELEGMTEDVHALSLLPDMHAAPDQWDALEKRLAEEGIIRPRIRWGGTTRFAQIAAAILLFGGGAAAGRLSEGPRVAPVAQHTVESPAPAPTTPQVATSGEATTALPETVSSEPRAGSNVTLASNAPAVRTEPRTIEEAAALIREREEQYLAALTRYAELTSQSEAGDPIARAAAMASIVMTTQAALNQLPTDPVINGYHLTAVAQRDAALRQVAANTSDRWY